jgi:RecA/RadA recombinase
MVRSQSLVRLFSWNFPGSGLTMDSHHHGALLSTFATRYSLAQCQVLYRRVCGVSLEMMTSADAYTLLTGEAPDITDANDKENLKLYAHRRFCIPTGLPSLDRHPTSSGKRMDSPLLSLVSPIGSQSLTEIMGPPGVGKSCLAWQLCIQAVASAQGSTVYIDTENKVSVQRLQEMAHQTQGSAEQILEQVLIHSVRTMDELMDTVTTTVEEEIMERNQAAEGTGSLSQATETIVKLPVRLLIIDSIAAPLLRLSGVEPGKDTDLGRPSMAQRAGQVFRLAQCLKRYADQYNLAVVVINQCLSSSTRQDSHEYRAALGTSWYHCVSTRLLLAPDDGNSADNGTRGSGIPANQSLQKRRRISVVKCNAMGQVSVPYAISSSGLTEA